jgi:hypothetical protein
MLALCELSLFPLSERRGCNNLLALFLTNNAEKDNVLE